MRVGGIEARRAQPARGASRIAKVVLRRRAVAIASTVVGVPALDEHRAASHRQQLRASLLDLERRTERAALAKQRLGLVQVGRDDDAAREDGAFEQRRRVLVQEPRAARRHHHRVADHSSNIKLTLVHRVEKVGHLADDGARAEHAELDRLRGQIVAQRAEELLRQREQQRAVSL